MLTVDINYLDECCDKCALAKDDRVSVELPPDWNERDIAAALERLGDLQEEQLNFGRIIATPRYLGNVEGLSVDVNYLDAFKEAEHPRGQPENKGEFAKGQGATSSSAELKSAGPNRENLPAHIKSLVIPPAWKDVRFNPNPTGNLQVTGVDAKGRRQSIYHPKFRASQAAAKFARIKELETEFAKIQHQNTINQGSGDPVVREHADITALIMNLGIRPGSDNDTKAAAKAYGATTLLGKHVVLGKPMRLKFVGKKGVPIDLPVMDPALNRMLTERAKAAGPSGKLFPSTDQRSLLNYVHEFDGGGFKTKDFRTLLGTKTAMRAMETVPTPQNMVQYKSAVKKVATVVSEQLGNTPTVALQSYINPVVFASWLSELELKGVKS